MSRPYLLTTHPGLEDVVADEYGEVCGVASPAPVWHHGCVRVEADDLDPLLGLSTIHHIFEIRHEGTAGTVEDVKTMMADADFPELEGAASFRVTSERLGEQDFNHVDIERAAGGTLFRRHGTPVDLREPEIDVHVNLYGDHLVAGLRRTEKSLANRLHRARALRSSLKPTIAAALLRLTGAHRGPGRLLDPMCGAGTIPVEACRINPDLSVFASDWDPETLEVARETAANHSARVEFRCADARRLEEVHSEPFDYLLTDPPYGVRQAKHTGLTKLYADLLPSFERVLAKTGKIALVVVKYRAFRSALEESSLQIEQERTVDLGGLCPRLLVLKKS